MRRMDYQCSLCKEPAAEWGRPKWVNFLGTNQTVIVTAMPFCDEHARWLRDVAPDGVVWVSSPYAGS